MGIATSGRIAGLRITLGTGTLEKCAGSARFRQTRSKSRHAVHHVALVAPTWQQVAQQPQPQAVATVAAVTTLAVPAPAAAVPVATAPAAAGPVAVAPATGPVPGAAQAWPPLPPGVSQPAQPVRHVKFWRGLVQRHAKFSSCGSQSAPLPPTPPNKTQSV